VQPTATGLSAGVLGRVMRRLKEGADLLFIGGNNYYLSLFTALKNRQFTVLRQLRSPFGIRLISMNIKTVIGVFGE
jgi:hypothetical protein